MKEATGETSMVVITIVIIGALLLIGTSLFKGGTVQKWIEDTFKKETNVTTTP